MHEWWGIPVWALPLIAGLATFDVLLAAYLIVGWLRR
jgi:hypothetical protein